MAKRRHRAVEALLRASARLSLPRAHRLGWLLGMLLWRLPSEPRRVAGRNLELVFPELDGRARARLLRESLGEAGKLLLELGPLWLWPAERVLALVRGPVAGEAALAEAAARGRGVILTTPHLGAWEVAGLYHSSRYPMSILYRPSRIGLDAMTTAARARCGAEVVATDARGVRGLLRALRRGQVLGILPDQDPGLEAGILAPFFGIPAYTMTLVSRLAMKDAIPVFLTWAERLPEGKGYTVQVRPLPAVSSAATLEDSVAALNLALEAAIRTRPAQYLWAYRRFKTRPPGLPKLY